jgi:uncharacterized protein YdcH (DUF465 family)
MRLLHPEKHDTKFDNTHFRRALFKSHTDLNNDINNVDYSKVTTAIFKDVQKRKKLWKVDQEVKKVKNKCFETLVTFINNTLQFL